MLSRSRCPKESGQNHLSIYDTEGKRSNPSCEEFRPHWYPLRWQVELWARSVRKPIFCPNFLSAST